MTAIRDFNESLKADTVVMSQDVKILIMGRDGCWSEVGRRRIKLGNMEIED